MPRPVRSARASRPAVRATLRWAIVALAAVLSIVTASLQASPACAASALSVSIGGDRATSDSGSSGRDELCAAFRGFGRSLARVEQGAAPRLPEGLFRSLPAALRVASSRAGDAFSTLARVTIAPLAAPPWRARVRLMVFLN